MPVEMDRNSRDERNSMKSRYRDNDSSFNRDGPPQTRGGYRNRLPYSSSHGSRGSRPPPPQQSQSSSRGGDPRMSRGGGSRMSSGYRPMNSRGHNSSYNNNGFISQGRQSSNIRGGDSRDSAPSYYDSSPPPSRYDSRSAPHSRVDMYESVQQSLPSAPLPPPMPSHPISMPRERSGPSPYTMREPMESKYASYSRRNDAPQTYSRNDPYFSTSSRDIPMRNNNDPYLRDFALSSSSVPRDPYLNSREQYRNDLYDAPLPRNSHSMYTGSRGNDYHLSQQSGRELYRTNTGGSLPPQSSSSYGLSSRGVRSNDPRERDMSHRLPSRGEMLSNRGMEPMSTSSRSNDYRPSGGGPMSSTTRTGGGGSGERLNLKRPAPRDDRPSFGQPPSKRPLRR
ncbi:unnamed protein product [Didymodactylos carnosus]|uniref:Uncharacterized protein n=1 Tax=Didymodactylos carnosus TaxID=1234261 RepID=A0A814FRZ3_9BILA|nr:unnamed protein product [Didymodactylos carnosus]CAF0987463.1 unnamed protein product [Didymodactylos carnosus]CAF3544427.1 unnamed protein product [Didymodactylos carnosus]CAF3759613.1 unnamed protein product [Didymodactylos carnosus]